MNNAERAQRAETALAGYTGGDPEDLTATIVDLITDLLHLGFENDLDVDRFTVLAHQYFFEERREEEPGP
jgi:hypothetical protein